ncbi:putative chromatin regulator PHD family [Lupinus albus]|uniref:Putative chromatin regulator PHD family n=1 Tax=Lupinus albus TaxID=3870 RepID=A0A6A4MM02_LUPAL|nr:putative chromatin regulator PHD family [Lupinus albus]
MANLCSYTTIRGTNKVVRAGDCVLMRTYDHWSNLPRVAQVQKIAQDDKNNVIVCVRLYYRPQESIGGRREFHGVKELFLSDRFDFQSGDTIEGKCVVHSFKNYMKLENVSAEDYYCRFQYQAVTGVFSPDRVAVYCNCEMPRNPDYFMLHCKECKDWYHPSCVGMTIEDAMNLDEYVCSECSTDDDVENPQATLPESQASDGMQCYILSALINDS